MTLPQIIVFSILAATLLLFLWGRWRHDVVALAALMACVVAATGLLPAVAAFAVGVLATMVLRAVSLRNIYVYRLAGDRAAGGADPDQRGDAGNRGRGSAGPVSGGRDCSARQKARVASGAAV